MGFDEAYAAHRGELYVALALATGSRDVAADTVDEAYRGWHARVLRRRLPAPEEAAVMSVALRRIARMTRDGADVPQGFRLRTAPLDEGHRGTLREFRALPLAPRMAIVLSRRLDWDDDAVAAATGLDASSLDAQRADAMRQLAAALGVDEVDASTLLDHALDAEADGLREPISRADGMRTAGLVTRIMRAVGGMAIVVAAGVGLVVGITSIDFGSESPSSTAALPGVTTPDGSTTVVTGPPTLDEVTFAWTAGSLPIARNSGDIRSISATGDEVVIVGMEYTQRSQPIIARSSDGLDWELLGAPFVGDGDLVGAAASDGLYAVAGNRWDGIGPSVSLWISTDGFDWAEIPVPIEQQATIGGLEVQVFSWVQRVDIIGEEIMIVLQSNAELDERALEALIPGGFGNGGWGTSTEGIQVYDDRGGATFFSWDELGLSDEEIALIAPGARLLTTADRGVTWSTEVLPASGGIMSVAAGEDLVGVVTTDLFGPELWIRRGGAWAVAEIDLVASAVAVHAGVLYAIGETGDGSAAVWRTIGGDGWEPVLEGIEAGQYQIAAGSAGLAAWSVGDNFGFARPNEIEIEGYRVEIYQMGGIRVYDGEELLAEFSQERVFMGGDGYEVTDADGNVLLVLNGRDLEQVFIGREEDFAPFGADLRLYLSANGVNWRRVNAAGELPESFFAFTGAPLGDGVALLGWDQRGEGGQQLWIGSPAA